MKEKHLTICIGLWLLLALAAFGSAARKALDLNPATAEQAVGHDLVRSAELGTVRSEGGRVNLMPWREKDDVIEGWDWSLPGGIEPVARSGLIFGRGEKRSFPGNKLADVAVFWRDVEPEEGRFDFEALRKKLENLPDDIVGYRFHFYASVAYRLRNNRKQQIGPKWLDK